MPKVERHGLENTVFPHNGDLYNHVPSLEYLNYTESSNPT